MPLLLALAVVGQVQASPDAIVSGAITDGCAGDCNGDGRVAVDELVRGVNIALGRMAIGSCESMDRNGDGHVGINELIAAVGNALHTCPCPFDLLDERAGQAEACVFVGRWNSACGRADLPATFSVQPNLVGVALVPGGEDPILTFFAQPTSGREANIVGFIFGEQTEQVGGIVRLSEDGRRMTVAPQVLLEVVIDQCPFESFDGFLARVVSTDNAAGAEDSAP